MKTNQQENSALPPLEHAVRAWPRHSFTCAIRRAAPALAALLMLTAAPALPEGPGLAAALAEIKDEISAVRRQLDEELAAAAEEKLDLNRQLAEKETEIAGVQAEIDRLERWRQMRLADADPELAAVKSKEESLAACAALFGGWWEDTVSRMLPWERDLAGQAALVKPAGGDAPAAAAAIAAMDRSWSRLCGGVRFDGEAVAPDGRVLTGRFVAIGPLAWFLADRDGATSPLAGPVAIESGAPAPVLAWLGRRAARAVRDLAHEAATSALPVDVTRGDALRIAGARQSWRETWRQGGGLMWPLALLALAALFLTVWRAVELARTVIPAPGLGEELARDINRGACSEAEDKTGPVPWPAGPLLRQALRHAGKGRERLETILHEQILGELPRLERHLGMLAVLAGVAPLLGLLGTVTGMIQTFDQVSLFGAGDVRILSGGISEALLTTRFGLAIAIPALMAHAVLSRAVRRRIGGLEALAIAFIQEIEGDEEDRDE